MTTLSLVSKVDHPSSIRDYRHISCCNNIYNAITRVLMRRMSGLMQELVSLSQLAFIPGRSISDSVLLLHELVQGYHKEDEIPKLAIKVDLQKAYDMVEWESLWVGMLAMGFAQRFIFLLKCITKASFSINLNGTLKGRFHPKCQQLGITHLSFADDMVLLVLPNMDNFRVIKETLVLFGDLTGLKLNCSETRIFFRSIPRDVRSALYDYMEMSEGVLLVKYLGIPLSSKSLTRDDYTGLVDRICGKISSWQSRHLSLGVRLGQCSFGLIAGALGPLWSVLIVQERYSIQLPRDISLKDAL
ncbi:hypothetical protein LIER_33835 [Lithospermum erythrorhizon]|uniref:Reverse transcriptase domain-containing protein n=1 Tax=Lithospermum erythrorhizon TaxID=34254 RepID=A0AAV3RZ99_LITER